MEIHHLQTGYIKAKKMLCLGFAQEILERCDIEGLRERAELALRSSLESSAVAK